jgi:hypothetical protein
LDEPIFATKVLAALDELSGPAPDSFALRLDLIARIVGLGDVDHLVPALLVPIVSNVENQHLYVSDPVLGAFDCTYRTVGQDAVVNIIARACAEFQGLPLVQSVLALCKCPSSFASADAIAEYDKAIDKTLLAFSAAMSRDALIIAARASESRGDFVGMREAAEAAHFAGGNSIQTQYWKIRAQLHDDAPLDHHHLDRSRGRTVQNQINRQSTYVRIDFHFGPHLSRSSDTSH